MVKTPASDFAAVELAYFTQVAAHEAIHRDFFKAAITKVAMGTPIMDLTPDFSSIDFTKRASVLGASKAFEDLGVAAYNGAGKLITPGAGGDAYLTLAGKIVSVEARHAAVIRELIATNTFVASDVVDTTTTGLEKSKRPQVVLATANNFLAAGSKLSANNFA